MHKNITLLAIFLLIFLPFSSQGLTIEERFDDPTKEQRAQNLFKGLRCVTCTSESINDSKAHIAVNLRKLVRKRIKAGDSDTQIMAYITERYGDKVLMRPPLKRTTYLLWFGPLILLLLGTAILGVYIKKSFIKQRP